LGTHPGEADEGTAKERRNSTGRKEAGRYLLASGPKETDYFFSSKKRWTLRL
jgi:hypothetical protein